MRLFAFGLGYAARRILGRLPGVEASGATREAAAAAAWRSEGVAAFGLDDAAAPEILAADLRSAEALLISAPPNEAGDPALGAYRSAFAAASNLKRIVYLSSVGVYGDCAGAWVDETAVCTPNSRRSRWRLAAERSWSEFASEKGVALDILRLAGIYGPGRSALEKLRAGEARRIVKPGQVFNRIHVDDLATVAARLIQSGRPGGLWNVADEEPAPPQEVIAFAAALLGAPPPPEEDFAAAELSPMAKSFYAGNRRVSVNKLRRELGYRWLYPTYREGLRALAATVS
ncbi:MAG: SDR family oxidoreductase [Bradyrhizobium sp.]|nr:MAG: SDR family oxidoreductase [Bradyrhizobium sp.]